MVLVLANAITAAALHFNHHTTRDDSGEEPFTQLDGFYFAEVSLVGIYVQHWTWVLFHQQWLVQNNGQAGSDDLIPVGQVNWILIRSTFRD